MSVGTEKLAKQLNETTSRLPMVSVGFVFAFGTAGCATTSVANDNVAPSSSLILVAANDNVAPSPQSPPPVATYYFPSEKVAGAEAAPLRDHLVAGKNSSHLDGLEPDFAKRLSAMFVAMPDELQGSTKILSGYRSIEHQRRLFKAAVLKYGSEKAARRWVAPPGRSMHQRGLAVDLQYDSKQARIWFHANAGKFGLHFPLSNENWHIEPIGARSS